MRKFRKLVFWQNMPSHHQVETLKGLVKLGHKVVWNVDQVMIPERSTLGWKPVDTEGIEVNVVGKLNRDQLRALINPQDLHIFAPRGITAGWLLLEQALLKKIEFGFLGEAPTGVGIKKCASALFYRLLASLLPEPRLFLAMGEGAASFYKEAGFTGSRPFWYTVPAATPKTLLRENAQAHRFLVVARLIKRKQVVLVINALAGIKDLNWKLKIVGSGPERCEIEKEVNRLGLADHVQLCGSLPIDMVRDEIATADTLVLASEWEGWGAVINEALAEGTRFVVSSSSGSSCLAKVSENCVAFDARNLVALQEALISQIRLGAVTESERLTRKKAHELIDGISAARYFSGFVCGPEVLPPWHAPMNVSISTRINK